MAVGSLFNGRFGSFEIDEQIGSGMVDAIIFDWERALNEQPECWWALEELHILFLNFCWRILPFFLMTRSVKKFRFMMDDVGFFFLFDCVLNILGIFVTIWFCVICFFGLYFFDLFIVILN